MTEPIVPTPKSGAIMREEILGMGKRWVGFKELLEYSWSLGIPVLHVSGFPKSAKKPHCLTLKIKDRPVIVLCVKHNAPAWLLFILAHELGHVCLSHIENDGVLLDEDVEHNERDIEEDAANTFAIELLTGSSEPVFPSFDSGLPNARELALWAKETGLALRIDPGHLVLNRIHSIGDGYWDVANAALAILRASKGALDLVRRLTADRLDWSRLPEQSSRFLLDIMNAPHAEPTE